MKIETPDTDVKLGFRPSLNPLPFYGVLEGVGNRAPPQKLMDAAFNLWGDSGMTPAMWDHVAKAWRPAPALTVRIGMIAHLLGTALIGIYPFRGLARDCDCPRGQHVCPGRGTNFFLLDLDGHGGEGDVGKLAVRLHCTILKCGLRAVAFSSRSGTGVHFYVFLDANIPTAETFAVGAMIRQAAGVPGNRCDVIPSAGHGRGLGTQACLPLSPQAAREGGGWLLDEQLRPVFDPAEIVARLEWAHGFRNSAAVVRHLARQKLGSELVVGPTPTSSGAPGKAPATQTSNKKRLGRKTKAKSVTPLKGVAPADRHVIAAMAAAHPQYRRALAVPAEQWKGGRSAKDAYLAAFLRRQGVSAKAQAAALENVPDSKAQSRGRLYTLPLAQWKGSVELDLEAPFAGTSLAYTRNSRYLHLFPPTMTGVVAQGGGAPWVDRVAPPLEYEGTPNPWWRADVQERLRSGSRKDAIVLAYVVDVWFRGPFARRTFYASNRMLSQALEIPARTAHDVVARLRATFPDVLAVAPGVPHATLRIANAFSMVGIPSADAIEMLADPGQDAGTRLSLTSEETLPDVGPVADVDAAETEGASLPLGDAGARPLDGDACRGAGGGVAPIGTDVDPTDGRGPDTGTVLRGRSPVAAPTPGLPDELRGLPPRFAGPGDGGGSVGGLPAAAGDEGDGDVWDTSVPGGTAELCLLNGRRRSPERARRALPCPDPEREDPVRDRGRVSTWWDDTDPD